MRVLSLLFLLGGWSIASATEWQPAAAHCTAPAECRQLTLDALAGGDYERAHDLAWRVVQTSPRRDHDPAALSLLARAQSLSGRGYDALIALQRLAGMGILVDDADTSEDFRRVRDFPQWPALLDAMTALRSRAAPAAPVARVAPDSVAPAAPVARDAPVALVALVAPVAPRSIAPAATVRTLSLPSSITNPTAIAYDAVSARFVIASGGSDSLQVLSENSGNATNLVSDGWSGNATVSAVAIDHRRGDLWVAEHSDDRAALHRLQLISGRQLETIAPPADAGTVALAALAVAPDAVFALDTSGRRIFTATAKATTLRSFIQLRDINPTGLAFSRGALYVAHAGGLVRVDLASRAVRPVTTPKGVDIANLRSLAWHDGALLGVQQKDANTAVVRVRLNSRGLTVTSLDVLEKTGETAATLSGEMYCYLTSLEEVPAVTCRTVSK